MAQKIGEFLADIIFDFADSFDLPKPNALMQKLKDGLKFELSPYDKQSMEMSLKRLEDSIGRNDSYWSILATSSIIFSKFPQSLELREFVNSINRQIKEIVS